MKTCIINQSDMIFGSNQLNVIHDKRNVRAGNDIWNKKTELKIQLNHIILTLVIVIPVLNDFESVYIFLRNMPNQ